MSLWLLLAGLALGVETSDEIESEFRALQVLRTDGERYRIVKEPFEVQAGPVVLTIKSGVLVPVFSGYTPRDAKGRRRAKAEAWEQDGKAPPTSKDAPLDFAGFVFTAAEADFEVHWQERADHLVFANHMVANVGHPKEDFVDIAHGAPWTGLINEGMVLSMSPEVRKAFLGPDDQTNDPLEIVVYGEKDYQVARLRAKILLNDRQQRMRDVGFRPGTSLAHDRMARNRGQLPDRLHTILDLHIDQNVGKADVPLASQPSDIDWITLMQDWTGAMDSRRHTVLKSLDIDREDLLVADPITGIPFAPEDPDDPRSSPKAPVRVDTDEAFVTIQAVPLAADMRVEVSARMKVTAVGADQSLFQVYVPRAGDYKHLDILGATLLDGTSILSKSALIEHSPNRPPPEISARSWSEGPRRMDAGSTGGASGNEDATAISANRESAPEAVTPGESGPSPERDPNPVATEAGDPYHDRPVSRITLTLPEPLAAGESMVFDLTWQDRWPLANQVQARAGRYEDSAGVTTSLGASSGAQTVIPKLAGSLEGNPTRFTVRVAYPVRMGLEAAMSGQLLRGEKKNDWILRESGNSEHPVPHVDVAIGTFPVHDEPGKSRLPTVRVRMAAPADPREIAAEVRAQIHFLQGYLPPYPWPEHEVVDGRGGINHGTWSGAHEMTAVARSGSTNVFAGGELTRETGKRTTQANLARQLAQQWWGQAVQPAHVSDFWWSETFTEVFALMYIGALEPDLYDRAYREKRTDWERFEDLGIPRASLTDAYDSPFKMAIVRKYGPYVMQQMLRPRVGHDRYHAALDLLVRDYQYGTITTEQLQSHLEKSSGKDLGDFFDFWVYGGFIPTKVALKWHWDGEAVVGEVTSNVPFGTFDVPIQIDDQTHWVEVVDARGTLKVAAEQEPEAVDLDPEHMILTTRRVSKKRPPPSE